MRQAPARSPGAGRRRQPEWIARSFQIAELSRAWAAPRASRPGGFFVSERPRQRGALRHYVGRRLELPCMQPVSHAQTTTNRSPGASIPGLRKPVDKLCITFCCWHLATAGNPALARLPGGSFGYNEVPTSSCQTFCWKARHLFGRAFFLVGRSASWATQSATQSATQGATQPAAPQTGITARPFILRAAFAHCR